MRRVTCRPPRGWATGSVTLCLLVLVLGATFWPTLLARVNAQTGSGDRVYGQDDDSTNSANQGGVSATSLSAPESVALDSDGGLYVADADNNRVLHYPAASTTADRVYGQPDFAGNTPNNGGVSAESLNCQGGLRDEVACGIALDPTGGLYVADSNNNRVLHYSGTSTAADRVYGQGGDFGVRALNSGGVSAMSLYGPEAEAVDHAGGLYIADSNNNRVLHYSGANTVADRVYGQAGDLGTNTINKGGLGPASLHGPCGVTLDPPGGLYICDNWNNRVVRYPTAAASADRMYIGLICPCGVALAPDGGLYVGDTWNNRVLHFPETATSADQVYGQAGGYGQNVASRRGPLSAAILSFPYGLAVDDSGGLYVGDTQNNRVLYFAAGSLSNASDTPTPALSTSTTPTRTPSPTAGATSLPTAQPSASVTVTVGPSPTPFATPTLTLPSASPAAATATPSTISTEDAITPGIQDPRLNTYRKRQAIRDQYRGKMDEAIFNQAVSNGVTLEAALAAAIAAKQDEQPAT